MTSERDVHPDEGTIHAWLDRQLDDASSSTLEAHLQRCDACAERVAEARGLIAGASRIITSLDDPSHVFAPAMAPRDGLQFRHPEPSKPEVLVLTGTARFPAFRLTPTRSAIAAVLVVAVGLAILNESKRPTSELARERGVAAPAAPLAVAPAPAAAPSIATLDTTAPARVAAARTFARTQRETTTAADRAQTGSVAAAASASPVEQTIAAARAADSAVRPSPIRSEAADAPLLARSGVAGGLAGKVAAAPAAAPVAAPGANSVEAPQCYRVESATGAGASWGDVALPFTLALDAPGTRNTARVLTTDGKPSGVGAVFERRGGDSLLFTMRRIGYTGTLAMGEPGDVRAGVMRSAPVSVALEQTVVTATGTTSPAEPRRMRAQTRAAAPREDSAAASAQRRAIPAVPVVVRRVACGG